MDARREGYGWAIPQPYGPGSVLGAFVFFEFWGRIEIASTLTDCPHFKKLLEDYQKKDPEDSVTITEEEFPNRTVAFTTGSVHVEPVSSTVYSE